MHCCMSAQHYCQQYSRVDIPQAVNEDGVLAWTQVTVLRSFRPRLPDTPFLRVTTAAGQVLTNCVSVLTLVLVILISTQQGAAAIQPDIASSHCRRSGKLHCRRMRKGVGSSVACRFAALRSVTFKFCGAGADGDKLPHGLQIPSHLSLVIKRSHQCHLCGQFCCTHSNCSTQCEGTPVRATTA